MTIRTQLVTLVQLQEAELEISRLQALVAAMPEQRAQLQNRVEVARSGVADAEQTREASHKNRRSLEGELAAAEAKIDEYQTREMQVKTNEQLWALQEQTKAVRDKAGVLEERILEEMERADACANEIKAAGLRLQEVEKEVERELAAVDAREAEVEGELGRAESEAEALRGQLDPELRALYERVKSLRGGTGLAELRDGNCTGCNVRLRPQVVVEIMNMGEARQCDNCKRIMFSPEALELPSSVPVQSAD